MLGFDALGKLALGSDPNSGVSTVILVAATGAFAVTGAASTTSTQVLLTGISYAVAGSANSFVLAEGAVAGAYAVAGGVASFRTSVNLSAASYAVAGFQTGALVMVTLGATYAVTGAATPLVVSINGAPGSYATAGNAAHFSRDFINWYPAAKPSTTWTPDPAQTIPASVVN